MNRGKLRELVREIQHLTDIQCHTEARLKLACAFDCFQEGRVIMALDQIHKVEGRLTRSLLLYREEITCRVLRCVEAKHGHEVRERLENALYRVKGEG